MDHFGRLLKQANNNMMRHFDQFARQYDLTGNQMAVIDFITNHADQEVFQRDIEHEFEIQRFDNDSALTANGEKGLIERHTSSKDARQKAVVLTDKALTSLLPVNLIFEKRKKSLPSNFQLKREKSFSRFYNTTVIFKFI